MANVLDDPWVAEAVRRFQDDYRSVIANRRVDVIGKNKSILKFGRNLDLTSGTQETIWDVGIDNETYVEDNLINRISSSSASDTQTIRVEGHYLADGGYHFVILDVPLNGQTPVGEGIVITDAYGQYGGALARNSRLANLSGTRLVGDVYVYQDTQTVTAGVPQDLTKVHAKIRGAAGLQQSNKCATTISNEDFYILTSSRVGVAKAQAAFVDFSLEVREHGGTFRERTIGNGSRDSGFNPIFEKPPYIVVPPNSDIRITGISSANTTTGIAEFNGILGALV